MASVRDLLDYGCGDCGQIVTNRDISDMTGLHIGDCQFLRTPCSHGGNAINCHLVGGPALGDLCGQLDQHSPFVRSRGEKIVVSTPPKKKKGWFGL